MYEKQSKLKLITTVVAVLVIAGTVLFVDHLKSAKTTAAASLSPTTVSQQAIATSPAPTAPMSPAMTTTSAYKDGTFTASSSYYVPDGNETIAVRLTIQNGVITASSIANTQGNQNSAQYQGDFASVYKSYVVGKSIASLKLGIIAGASDTTHGFNDAVSRIAIQAHA